MVKSCYLFLNTCWSANAGVRSDGLGLGKQPVPAGRCDFHRMLPQGGNLLCLMLGRDFTLPGMAGTFFFFYPCNFSAPETQELFPIPTNYTGSFQDRRVTSACWPRSASLSGIFFGLC